MTDKPTLVPPAPDDYDDRYFKICREIAGPDASPKLLQALDKVEAEQRAKWHDDNHWCRYRKALEEIDTMDPEQFKTGQDHLPPAFRVPNIKEAFRQVCVIVNRVLHNADSEDAGDH